ncbi:hypothetical protein AG1IA_08828 [Rhizoctonia solani AG-1 IA]|uniref:Uncharacterized protein n=1 Tax=Thanatephorus cucumeris (strain AG1-IA) TaxID=983506 RepID=L8WG21_THACA|nr:hypothetical protein AG1IA_08828 [Rhizoctonia solani AG-1 IA]
MDLRLHSVYIRCPFSLAMFATPPQTRVSGGPERKRSSASSLYSAPETNVSRLSDHVRRKLEISETLCSVGSKEMVDAIWTTHCRNNIYTIAP